MKRLTVYDLVLMAVLTSILFIQEQLLYLLPNIQLTIFLLVLYSKKLGTVKTICMIIVHVILDSLFTSSLGIIYTPFILVGWILIPVTLNTIFKSVNSNITLAFLGVLYAIIYSWFFVIPFVYMLKVDFMAYIITDIPFQLLLASSSFITILLLYEPSSRIFDYLLKLNKRKTMYCNK